MKKVAESESDSESEQQANLQDDESSDDEFVGPGLELF